jgi:hypothetical protein
MGQPVVWVGGSVVYFTDQGALSAYESNQAAQAMVAAAALPWTQVPTASVSIVSGGSLAEDVTGADVSGLLRNGTMVWPADVESLAMPVPILFDEDGSILNTIVGPGASDPSGCLTNAVTSISDGFSVEGNLTHAIVLLNGLCAQDSTQVANMQYLLTREFGRVLGLDWSQANDNVFTGNPKPTPSDLAGWPLMHPANVNCGGENYSCIPNAGSLRMDDRAALGLLYPSPTYASSTARVYGYVRFENGTGMQGVLVTATLLIKGTTTPATDMVASCISGSEFRGNAGNVVTGTDDAWGNPLARFGSSNWWVAGAYDLGGLEIPAGQTSADYQITFTALNPEYTGGLAVSPELLGAPAPSGTLATVVLRGLKAGEVWPQSFNISTSAVAGAGMGGSFSAGNSVPASGSWSSTLNPYGDVDWFELAVRPARQFSVITVAQNEAGVASQSKAMPLIGVWFAGDAAGVTADFSTPQAFDSVSAGTTVLEVQAPAADGAQAYPILLAIADARGDGRPDYAYSGRILYADSVEPAVVPSSGGVVTLTGMGFVPGDTVMVNGAAAKVLSQTAEQLELRVPASAVTGAADIQVNDPSGGQAVLDGALAYGVAPANTVHVISSLGGGVFSSGAVGAQAPGTFAVQAANWQGSPTAGAAVTFSATNGGSLSVCNGASRCTVTASASGYVLTALTPTAVGTTVVSAALADGASAQSSWVAYMSEESIQFAQTSLSVEPGVSIHWPVSVTALSNGTPMTSVAVKFELSSGTTGLAGGESTTNAVGLATYDFALPSLASGATLQVQACLPDKTCASLVITCEAPVYPLVIPIAGTVQIVAATSQFSPLQLQITDGAGEWAGSVGNPLAGATVTFAQTLYSNPAQSSTKGAPVKILASASTTVISDVNGMVTLQPLQDSNVAGRAVITASINGRIAGTYSLVALPTGGSAVASQRIPVL